LDSANISDDGREPAARSTEIEVVSVHAERRNLSVTE